jgi:hypothetical protein
MARNKPIRIENRLLIHGLNSSVLYIVAGNFRQFGSECLRLLNLPPWSSSTNLRLRATGKYRFRYCQTPHLPHGWDAGVLFEETQKTLLCSDLFHQIGDVEPLTSADVVGRSH